MAARRAQACCSTRWRYMIRVQLLEPFIQIVRQHALLWRELQRVRKRVVPLVEQLQAVPAAMPLRVVLPVAVPAKQLRRSREADVSR